MSTPRHPATIRLRDLTLTHGRRPAVHHVSGCFAPGSLTAVVGPNGAGKSTLLKAVTGALAPLSGKVSIEGCSRRRIGYLPQQADIDRSFPLPVFDFVAMGLWRAVGPFGAFRRRHDEEVARALAAVGLAGFERRTLDTLSGGQVQRVLFARLLLQDAPLVLLDEPFTAIDARTAADLMDLVLAWHREGRTIVTVLHDIDQVKTHFPQSILLARRVVAWGPTPEALSPANLLEARRMTEAFDDDAPVCRIGHDHR